jgi:hypothetical protein
MQQCRHIFFEQNHVLMNKSSKNRRCLGSPSQQGINKKCDERDRERHKLHIMVNKNYLQDVGLVSSGQRRKLHQ